MRADLGQNIHKAVGFPEYWPKNYFPNPSPSLAPFTNPAIIHKVYRGIKFLGRFEKVSAIYRRASSDQN